MNQQVSVFMQEDEILVQGEDQTLNLTVDGARPWPGLFT
jgi:hypothetical protein